MISGVGSSHLFEFLLNDGSVSINYGTCDHYEGFATFYDDYFISGIDWVRGLYYVNKSSCKSPSQITIPQRATHCLIKLAMQTVQNPLSFINVTENLSLFGMAVSNMAQQFPDSWESLRKPACKMHYVANSANILHGTDICPQGDISQEAASMLRSDFLAFGSKYPCIWKVWLKMCK